MDNADARITIRIDEKTKDEAEKLFNKLGISLNTGIQMFLKQAVREQAIPFKIVVDKDTPSDEILAAFRSAVIQASETYPLAKYDPKTKAAYLLYEDGRKEYINEQ